MKVCPRHQSTLSSCEKNGHHVDLCPDCRGLWVPGPEIDALLGQGQSLQLRSQCSVLPSELPCPSACGQMFQGKIGQVQIDLCQGCGGLWLDRGELESLLNRRKVSPHTPIHGNKAQALDSGGEVELALLTLSMFL
ncbi:MAG: zf-TFIIB domain-containing protein [Akkermansiaceae bacterium]